MNPFPMPVRASDDSRDFFEATRSSRLLLRRCSECAVLRGPHEQACPECHSVDHETQYGSVQASLVTWSIVYRSPLPGVATPYVTGFVECEEGPWLAVRLLPDASSTLRTGARVLVTFLPTGADQDQGEALPVGLVLADNPGIA